jgi:hypothetical protein
MIGAILTVVVFLAGSASGYRLVVDTDKNGFNELKAIHLDINDDGRIDTIQPRILVRRGWVWDAQGKHRHGTEHWITFDLVRTSTQPGRTVFEYRYGDEHADYWVWALIPAGDLDGNGQIDLVFYSGDDTTDETVILLQNGSTFRRCSTGSILGDYNFDSSYNVTTLESYDIDTQTVIPARIVGRWNGAKVWFEGTDLYWIHRQQLALRAEPHNSAKLIQWLGRDDAVINRVRRGKAVKRGGWLEVETTFGRGWVQRSGLVTNSRFVTP